MRTGIEQARIELAKWEGRIKQDEEALAIAERSVADIQERLARSCSVANGLRSAVQQWDALAANSAPDNL